MTRVRHFHPETFMILLLSGAALLFHPKVGVSSDSSPEEKETILDTTDGMILLGAFERTGDGFAVLETRYGTLKLPLDQIARINGERFLSGKGILREHSIRLERNGDVQIDYLVPVSIRVQGGVFNLLVVGKVLEVKDPAGHPMSFYCEERSGYTRCSVQLPEYRLSALTLRVLQKGAAQTQGNHVYFTYPYTPDTDQTFRLNLSLPASAETVETTPEAVRDASGALIWERPLSRQETAQFEVSFEIK